MRTIKFRGKRVDNGEWVYGYLIRSTHQVYAWIKDSKVTNPRQINIATADFRCVEVNPKTVGQCIGLSDKNKQEIYDGDICKVTQGWGEAEMGEVAWDEQSLCWALDIGRELWHFGEIIDCGHLVEAIGNIYDHLHLLEQQTPEVTS